MQEDGQTTEDQDHRQTYPLHCIDLAMPVIHPKNLPDGCNHSDYGCRIDIAKFKGNKEEDDGEEVE
jgi:hypothetical protein